MSMQAEDPEPSSTVNGSQEKSQEKSQEEPDNEETGSPDEPETSNRLEDPEVEDIKTITAGDTMYSSAKKFEDLPISEPLLQVFIMAIASFDIIHILQSLPNSDVARRPQCFPGSLGILL